MQYKKGEKKDQEELPTLTQNQEAYVHARMAGKRPVEAYREAYPNWNGNQSSTWTEASKMEAHPKISLWLAQVNQSLLESMSYTKKQWIAEHHKLMIEAKAAGNHVAVRQYHRDIAEVLGITSPEDKKSEVREFIEALQEKGYGNKVSSEQDTDQPRGDRVTH